MHEAKEDREEKMDMHPGGKIEACERSTLLALGFCTAIFSSQFIYSHAQQTNGKRDYSKINNNVEARGIMFSL